MLNTWTGPPLVGVDGTRLETWGTATTEIAFVGETFQFPVLVGSSLTADAILGMDFLDANKCTLEMANKVLRFPNRGSVYQPARPNIAIPHHTSTGHAGRNPQYPTLQRDRSEAKVSEGLHQGTWLLEECKSKNLPVRVTRALVNPVTPTVPVRLLNLSSDTTTVFKGTKVATVEECNPSSER